MGVRSTLLVCTAALGSIIWADQLRGQADIPVAVDQGPVWTENARDTFYTLDQGSRLMPLKWVNALKRPNGMPFMTGSLARFGFLANDRSPARLPAGFTVAGPAGQEVIGLTCAACHTRQIRVENKAYRIDGGPAIIDFQAFLSELDAAVASTLADATRFTEFAQSVLGTAATAGDIAKLKGEVEYWHRRHHALMAALPTPAWGAARVDAIGMIYNRLTGLDLGPDPDHILQGNIVPADAPARYPFLWNASKQDRTQWPGFQENDNDDLRLLRNIGQVIGVFAEFLPQKSAAPPHDIDYWAHNSVNIEGLRQLEDLTTKIAPPRWPWPIDLALAARGETIFNQQCDRCHGARQGSSPGTFETMLVPVSELLTDTREVDRLDRPAKTGAMEGATFPIPGIFEPLRNTEPALWILKFAAVGIFVSDPHRITIAGLDKRNAEAAFRPPSERTYAARVLEGVWAAAPYLHNGSVPTLADLLQPAARRPAIFKIGPSYDIEKVGISTDQPGFGSTLTTTDCSDSASGNSRCGHEYGTDLPESDKKALLEYLKKL